MITFFCIPKAFTGETGRRQMNALLTWKALAPECEVLVFGSEEGLPEACAKLDARHIPELARNEHGTPLLNHAFQEASRLARNELLCYANSDILLFPDFVRAARTLRREAGERFLAIGERCDFDAQNVNLLAGRNFPPGLHDFIRARGQMDGIWFIDYFLYPKPLFAHIPPFAVGRPAWDNWMIYEARKNQFLVVDLTPSVLIGHQRHGYGHTAEGRAGGRGALWIGAEATRNRELAGGHLFDISDATHELTADGSLRRRQFPRGYFLTRFREAHEIFPEWRWLLLPLWQLAHGLHRIDHGIRMFLLRRGIDIFPHKEKRRAAG